MIELHPIYDEPRLAAERIELGRLPIGSILSGPAPWSKSAPLGDAKSLVTHPAATHQRPTPQARAELGITDRLVRLSAGLEHIDDIAADLTAALEKV